MKTKNIINMILICWGAFGTGVALTILTPFYPSEALSKGVTVTQSGLVLSSVFIATLIFTPIFGKYIQTLGCKKFIILGASIIGIGNASFGFLYQVEETNLFFGLSILVRVIVAVGEASFTPAAFALAGKQVSPQNQGMAMSFAESFCGVGTMFGPTIGGYLYDIGGFPLPFWIFGGFSLLLAVCCVFLMRKVEEAFEETAEDQKDVSWREVLTAPGVAVSLSALICAGTAWQWYAPSLEPFLVQTYGVSSFQTGLVFMAFGVTYTLSTPIAGFLTDRGVDSVNFVIIGNFLILVAFIFLGPVPVLRSVLGSKLELTVVSVGLQGLGSGATYLGSLLLMMKGVGLAGLPDKEQTRGMVSSLWISADCIGGYLGATLGSLAYDNYGFESGSVIMAGIMLCSVISSCCYVKYSARKNTAQKRELEINERTRLLKSEVC